LGLTRETPGIARGVELLFERELGAEGGLGGKSSEVCFTGNCVRMFVQFGYGEDPRLWAAIYWLIAEQKTDGGWHCFRSDTGTLDSWEALAAFATFPPALRDAKVDRATERGVEFFLNRHLLDEGD
jgi:hypothetical protein